VFTGVEKTKVAQNQAKGPWRFHKINTLMMMVWNFKKRINHHNHGIGLESDRGSVLRYL
jgi:hypothetical protein